jgi:diaminopimelate decarboxylase
MARPAAMKPDHVGVAALANRFGIEVRDGVVFVDGVDMRAVADQAGTPTYVYGLGTIEARYRALAEAVGQRPTSICYAVKANASQAVLATLAALGAGADIVSGGELARARAAGIPAERIVFSGVGKTDTEIDAAIAAGVRSINVESDEELERIATRARAANRTVNVSLRVNPDVDPDTHPYLATGMRESKFGIPMSRARQVARRAIELQGIELVGVACHIGSMIAEASPYLDSLARLTALVREVEEDGASLRIVDLGGGLAIPYTPEDPEPDVGAWGRAVVAATKDLRQELLLEPGRWLVGNAGVLLTRVIGTKAGEEKGFVIVDAAMNDLIRPALYQAHHAIVPVMLGAAQTAEVSTVDVVGPVCECGDFLAENRAMPKVATGDLLVVLSAGAYGMVMASTYNTRPLAAEVVAKNGRFAITRKRKTPQDLIADETVPDWVG